MPEPSLETVLPEQEFTILLTETGESFFQLCNTLLALGPDQWGKRHLDQLSFEADELESYLDDYGAQDNQTFSCFRELVAAVRWLSLAGFCLVHMNRRLESYRVAGEGGAASGPGETLGSGSWAQGEGLGEGVGGGEGGSEGAGSLAVDLRRALDGLRSTLAGTLGSTLEEARALGCHVTETEFPARRLGAVEPRHRLPRNLGEEAIDNEEQRIAELATKYLETTEELRGLRVHAIEDPVERRAFLGRVCGEERARVLEARVHNLQSAYDTHVKHTVIERGDERLPQLRGYISATLHLMQVVTALSHFVERHESGVRSEAAEQRLSSLVARDWVEEIILNVLLIHATRLMWQGKTLAEDLLPSYINVQEIRVSLPDDVKMHARPASLIVGVVNHYGTPVELEVGGDTCNAASILELLVCVGGHPDAREFVFRGDENPLADIKRLFGASLGENGLEHLPGALGYLRGDG